MEEDYMRPSGWRVSLSIIAGVAWLIFVIVWLAFYAGNYDVYRNIAIVLISILVMIVVLGVPWAVWAIRYIPEEGREMMKAAGFTSRVAVSIVIPFALLIFLIVWFYCYASDFNVYQNIAIFLVSVLAVGGAMGAIWASWGMKYGKKFEEKYHKEEKED